MFENDKRMKSSMQKNTTTIESNFIKRAIEKLLHEVSLIVH